MQSETVAPSQALWDAVNAYAAACGGDTGDGTLGGVRSDAMAAVERAVAGLVQEWLEEAARVTLVDLAEPSDTTARKLLAREAAHLVPANLRGEVIYHLRVASASLDNAAEQEFSVEQHPTFEHGEVECVADCPACEYEEEADPRPSWKATASDLTAMADRLDAAPSGVSPLVVEAVRLALAAPYGRGAETRDVVDLAASVLGELFKLRGREPVHLNLLGQAASCLLSVEGRCREESELADDINEHVAKTTGRPYTRPVRNA